MNNFYHAEIIKYKLEDLRRSVEHFNDSFREIKTFCASFLDKDTYHHLELQKAFSLELNDKTTKRDVRQYLDQTAKIYSAIYGPSHLFVKDYALQNLTI